MIERSLRHRLYGTFNMAWANFDNWMHSPRTVVMLVFVLSECFILMRGLERMISLYFEDAEMHLMEMLVYRMAEGCNIAHTSLMLLVTINELPRCIGFQNYSMLRSNKGRWLAGQVLYCFMMVSCMILFMTLFMALCAVPIATPGGGWSDLERIEAGVSVWEEAILPAFLIQSFTPIQALLLCMVPLSLFWFTMMLVILLSGILGSSLIGVLLYAFMLVAHVTFLLDGILWFKFPIAFSTFASITTGQNGRELNALILTFAGYAIVIGALIMIMRWRLYRTDFDFFTQNKY